LKEIRESRERGENRRMGGRGREGRRKEKEGEGERRGLSLFSLSLSLDIEKEQKNNHDSHSMHQALMLRQVFCFVKEVRDKGRWRRDERGEMRGERWGGRDEGRDLGEMAEIRERWERDEGKGREKEERNEGERVCQDFACRCSLFLIWEFICK
jgi:hypothetical protein